MCLRHNHTVVICQFIIRYERIVVWPSFLSLLLHRRRRPRRAFRRLIFPTTSFAYIMCIVHGCDRAAEKLEQFGFIVTARCCCLLSAEIKKYTKILHATQATVPFFLYFLRWQFQFSFFFLLHIPCHYKSIKAKKARTHSVTRLVCVPINHRR